MRVKALRKMRSTLKRRFMKVFNLFRFKKYGSTIGINKSDDVLRIEEKSREEIANVNRDDDLGIVEEEDNESQTSVADYYETPE
jgi:hypothetical protein